MSAPRLEKWADGDRYERYMGRWSRRMAPHFLAWLHAPPGQRWLDVGSGTGALTQAILERCAPVRVVGVDRAHGFVEHAAAAVADPRVTFRVGEAGELPVEPGAFDRVVSGLMLNFVPDAAAALAEMKRAAAPGGTVALYVWDYAEGMEWLRRFWDAAAVIDPESRAFDQAERFPICRPEPLRAAFAAAGLANVGVTALDDEATFANFADYWAQFDAGGTFPAPAWLATRTPAEREHIRERLAADLPAAGPVRLHLRAWGVRGAA